MGFLSNILKYGFFIYIFLLIFSVLSFLLYSFYYGGAYVLSHFVTMSTVNIIHSSLVAVVIYWIYNVLFK